MTERDLDADIAFHEFARRRQPAAHDKYANQEVAYLLQRIESHNGLVILASNFKSNIDEAFMRRFQSVIFFPLPSPGERFTLWKKVLPSQNGMQIPSDNELLAISKKYEITGAGIVNAVQYCCLESLATDSHEITVDLIRTGIEHSSFAETDNQPAAVYVGLYPPLQHLSANHAFHPFFQLAQPFPIQHTPFP